MTHTLTSADDGPQAREARRLAALRALAVLDTTAEPLFDGIASAAAGALDARAACIVLVDREREWVKAAAGVLDLREWPRSGGIGDATIESDGLALADLGDDARLAAHPLRIAPHAMRRCACAPIRLDGLALGALCVLDPEARPVDARERAALAALAGTVAEALRLRAETFERGRLRQRVLELEHQMELGRRRLTDIAECSRGGTWEWEPDSGIATLSPKLVEILGLDANAHRVRDLSFVHELDREALGERLAALASSGAGEIDQEVRLHRSDGVWLWMHMRGRIGTGGRSPARVFGTCIDITARKKAETALHNSEERFRRLYQHTPAMLHALDLRGIVISVSDAWLQRLGYRRDEIIGRPMQQFISQESFQDATRRVAELLRFGRIERMPFQMRAKDGELVDVVLSAVLERNADGQPLRTLAAIEDTSAQRDAESRLRASEAFLDRTGQAAGVGGWELDLASGVMNWSAHTYRIHDLETDFEPTAQKAVMFYAPEVRPVLDRALRRVLKGGPGWDLELPFVTAAGRHIWVRTVGTAQTRDGRVVGMVGALQDITARKTMERELADSHELLRVTLQSIADAVITTDRDGAVRWCNPAAERMTGWCADEAAGQPLEAMFRAIDEDTRAPAGNPVRDCVALGRVVDISGNTLLVSRDGREYAIEESAAPIRDGEGAIVGAVLVFRDVSEQRQLTREMRHRARHDALTGLLNRTEFELHLGRVLDDPSLADEQHAVLYIDLDQFKIVNDSCGHAAGDQLLCQIAALLRHGVRTHDIIARLGGDEFAVFLAHCPPAAALRVARAICERLDNYRFQYDERRFRVGASVGLVTLPGEWRSVAAVLQAADLSCLAAKEAGRNRVHQWVESDETLQQRNRETRWASRLDQALEDDRLVLYAQRLYPTQPDADAPLHCEILLRYRDEDGSIISPSAFMPAAERFFQATRIDQWVLRQLLATLRRHPGFMDALEMVAINLSGHSVADRAFHRYAVGQLRQAGVDLRKLCFEITETVAITRLTDAALFVSQMRELGVRVALDDFGAGASSFGYLKHLNVDFLKIDGQFVRNLVDDPLDRAAVKCFQEVAAATGMRTIAECVERSETLEALRALGVDYVQGFLLHRPAPLDTLLDGDLHHTPRSANGG